MLVLSRKQAESIVIGNNITIKVIRISGGRVRLAIDAPEHIRIARGELGSAPLPTLEVVGDSPVTEFHQVP